MARDLMPKSGIMMPHIVVTRDAAVVGVSTVDGKAGSIDLTVTYRKIDDSYNKTEIYTKAEIDNLITPIMTGVLFKADPFVDNNVPFRSGGANGITSIDLIKAASDNSIHIGDSPSGVQGVHLFSEGRIDVTYKNDAGADTVAPLYSKRHRPEIVDMPFASVGTYVLDSKGRTVGVTKTGINSDLKTLTALTNINATSVIFEKSPVVPDPVNPYDVATKRYVDNQSGGSGPTMNGIMNYGVGSFRLHDSRAYIAPYEVVSDGQILDRALWPELWAHAQVHGAIDDSIWVADPSKRGLYSKGDGTTTFRVPDRNGVVKNGVNGFTGADSIEALFGRGDSGGNAGIVSPSGLPNITGTIDIRSGRTAGGELASSGIAASGAMIVNTNSAATNAPNALHSTSANNATRLSIDASTQNPIYGRTINELRPNSFFGVWVVRASGGFVAANTSWSVINADAGLPIAGVVVRGGAVNSEYRANDKTKHAIKIESVLTVGDSDSHGAMITHTLNTDGGALESERTSYIITDYEDSFLPWNDPRVLEWITWPSDISSTAYELMVKISRKYIVIKGVLRRTLTLSTLSVATFKKMPPGASRVVAPSSIAVFSVPPSNNGRMMTTALNATSNGVLSVENTAAGSSWVCLDVTAAFM